MNASLPNEAEQTMVGDLVARYGKTQEALLPILTEINDHHGSLTESVCIEVAHALDLSPSEVYGVATFYSYLSTKPRGKFIVRVCSTLTCDMAGKDAIINALEKALGIGVGETSADGKFTLETTQCIGLCDQGPALLVNDDQYTKVTSEMVAEILGKY